MMSTIVITLALSATFGFLSSWLVVKSSAWVSQNWGLGYTFIAGILLPIGTYHAGPLPPALRKQPKGRCFEHYC